MIKSVFHKTLKDNTLAIITTATTLTMEAPFTKISSITIEKDHVYK